MSRSAYARSAAFYDLIYGQKPYEGEAEWIHGRIRAHLRSGGNTLLDVGCGTGGHLAHLRGHYRCDGLDRDAGLLATHSFAESVWAGSPTTKRERLRTSRSRSRSISPRRHYAYSKWHLELRGQQGLLGISGDFPCNSSV